MTENRILEKYACDSFSSRGRFFSDSPLQFNRTEYQRDRDRILHCESFRRLKQKTQVFVNFDNDHFRTRLTHSLEVAQLARSISRYLYLNDDLSEAIALAHDLGHPPFGHAGEDALSKLMIDYDGFNHNEQTIRILTLLEKQYHEFDGLNLTFETLDGLIKHNGPFLDTKKIPKTIENLDKKYNFNLYNYPSLEAQVANICDDIAYVSHDLNDGFNSKILNIDEIENLPIIRDIVRGFNQKKIRENNSIYIHQITKNLMNFFVNDLVSISKEIIKKNNFKHKNDIINHNSLVIKMNPNTHNDLLLIKDYLLKKMYNNNLILKETNKVDEKIKKMFFYLIENSSKLPESWQIVNKININDVVFSKKMRRICDYISGMTNNYFNYKYQQFKLV